MRYVCKGGDAERIKHIVNHLRRRVELPFCAALLICNVAFVVNSSQYIHAWWTSKEVCIICVFCIGCVGCVGCVAASGFLGGGSHSPIRLVSMHLPPEAEVVAQCIQSLD